MPKLLTHAPLLDEVFFSEVNGAKAFETVLAYHIFSKIKIFERSGGPVGPPLCKRVCFSLLWAIAGLSLYPESAG